MSVIRASSDVQRRADERIAQIERTSQSQGNSTPKIQKGGGGGVLVSKKVAWPQDTILGGSTKQRLTYDQLTITQFVQGLTIADESCHNTERKCCGIFQI